MLFRSVAKATFPLATSESYTNQQSETITSTEWHNIVLWRALAEVAEKTVKKGSQVYIIGKIKTRSYVDKDGVNKYITEILADTLLVLEKKQSQGYQSAQSEHGSEEAQGKGSAGSSVNEPTAQYSGTNEIINKNWSDKNIPNSNDIGSLGKNAPGDGMNEDDLPF